MLRFQEIQERPDCLGLGFRLRTVTFDEMLPNVGRPFCGPSVLGNYHLSYSLNSLKGVYTGYIYIYIGTTIGDIKGDSRSLD